MVPCDFKRSELPSLGTRQIFPKETTSQTPSKRDPLGQLFFGPGVSPLGKNISLLLPLLYREHLCRLCGDISFCLFLGVKGAFKDQRVFSRSLFPFYFLTSVSEFAGVCRWSSFSCEVRYKDSFQQEGETRGSTGGRAPNVGLLWGGLGSDFLAFPLQQPGLFGSPSGSQYNAWTQKALFPPYHRVLHLDEAHFDYIMVWNSPLFSTGRWENIRAMYILLDKEFKTDMKSKNINEVIYQQYE